MTNQNNCQHYNQGADQEDFELCDKCGEMTWTRCPDCGYEGYRICACRLE